MLSVVGFCPDCRKTITFTGIDDLHRIYTVTCHNCGNVVTQTFDRDENGDLYTSRVELKVPKNFRPYR